MSDDATNRTLPNWLSTHPRAWQPGTLDRDKLHDAADALCADPSFDEASQEFVRHWLASFESEPVIKRVMRDTPLYLLLVFALDLHHRRTPAKPASGVTLSALQNLYAKGCTHRVFASASRVKVMLARARLTGLLQDVSTSGNQADRRTRPLEPTALLTRIFSRWIQGFLCGSARLLPLPAALRRDAYDAQFVCEVFSYRAAAYLQERFVLTERCQPVQAFMMREHGYQVFMRLMQTVRAEGGLYVARAPVGELSERFGIARATVRNVLTQAQEAGHLVSERAGARVVLSPAFVGTARRWLALEMVWMQGLACAAVRPHEAPVEAGAPLGAIAVDGPQPAQRGASPGSAHLVAG